MDKKAWVHQRKVHIDKMGADKASWYVTWNDPDGKRRSKSCGPGRIGKSAANKLADTIHSQLVTGTYETNSKTTWDNFFVKYKAYIERMYDLESRKAALLSINTFVRIANPKLMRSITTEKVDAFISVRRQEVVTNKKRKTTRNVSPATVNRELRYVRSAMRLAADWGYIEKVPRVRFLKMPEKLPTFVPPEHLAAMVHASEIATMPNDIPNVTPVEWWQGLLVHLYMCGWRVGQTLAVNRDDTDLEECTIFSRAEDNKGGRDERISIHPLAVQYLRPLMKSFDPKLFPWHHNNRTLWSEFARIQEASRLADGSPMPKAGKNGGWYGFHDLRRGFATMNAGSLNLFELQALMQHKSLVTTRGYVAMAAQLNRAVSNLYVPDLRVGETG